MSLEESSNKKNYHHTPATADMLKSKNWVKWRKHPAREVILQGSAVVFTNVAGVGSTIASPVGAMGLADGSKSQELREVSSTAQFSSEMLPKRKEDVKATVTLAVIPTKRSTRQSYSTILFSFAMGWVLTWEVCNGWWCCGGWWSWWDDLNSFGVNHRAA
jgi:hypothetical protein